MSIIQSSVSHVRQAANAVSNQVNQAANSVKNGIQVAGKTLSDTAHLVAAVVKAVALAVLVKIATPFVSESRRESLTERANAARQEVNRLRGNEPVKAQPSIKERAVDLGKTVLTAANNHKGKLALLAGLAATGAAAYAYGPSLVEMATATPQVDEGAITKAMDFLINNPVTLTVASFV